MKDDEGEVTSNTALKRGLHIDKTPYVSIKAIIDEEDVKPML